MNKDNEFFNKLAEELENSFPKGELCECGKRLPCRSKALVLNGFANIYHSDKIDSIKKMIERKETKCTCGCNFGDGCLCKEERRGYQKAKKDILKEL